LVAGVALIFVRINTQVTTPIDTEFTSLIFPLPLNYKTQNKRVARFINSWFPEKILLLCRYFRTCYHNFFGIHQCCQISAMVDCGGRFFDNRHGMANL
jgi:hypothetical protein